MLHVNLKTQIITEKKITLSLKHNRGLVSIILLLTSSLIISEKHVRDVPKRPAASSGKTVRDVPNTSSLSTKASFSSKIVNDVPKAL